MTSKSLSLSAGLALLILSSLLLGLSSCTMNKQEMTAALSALPDHAPVTELGLQEGVVEVDLGRGREEVRTTWVHRPATAAGETPVVLVHGTPSSLFTWAQVIDQAPAIWGDRAIWAVDLIGHGTTRSKHPPYTFASVAAALGGFLDQVVGEPVVLVANSYGGEVAWRVALDRPELVDALVLMDSTGLERRDDEWLPEEDAIRRIPGARFGWILNSKRRIEPSLAVHFKSLDPAHLEEVYLVCNNADSWRAMTDLCRDESGERQDELALIRQPTLLVWGDRDLAYPVERFAVEFERRIPDARLRVIEDCGHYPQEERPAELVALIGEFLAELRRD